MVLLRSYRVPKSPFIPSIRTIKDTAPLLATTKEAPSSVDSPCAIAPAGILARFLPEIRPFMEYVTSQGEYGSSHLERSPPMVHMPHPGKRVGVLAAPPPAARQRVAQWEGYGDGASVDGRASVDGDAVENARTIDAEDNGDDPTAAVTKARKAETKARTAETKARTAENAKAANARAAQGTIERQLEQFSVHKILTSNTLSNCTNVLIEIAPQRDLAFLATLADFLTHQQAFLAIKIGDKGSGNEAPHATLFADTAFTKVYRVTSAQYQRYCPERPALSQAKYDVVLRRAARTVSKNMKRVEVIRHKTATSILRAQRAQEAVEQEVSKSTKREKEAIAWVDALIDAEAAKVVAWREMVKEYKDGAGVRAKKRMAVALRTQAKPKTKAEDGPDAKPKLKTGAKAANQGQRLPKANVPL